MPYVRIVNLFKLCRQIKVALLNLLVGVKTRLNSKDAKLRSL